MGAVASFALEVLRNSLVILNEAALFILGGMAVAALLHEYLKPELIARYTGERSIRSVVMATLLGAPLPLCSCGVVPTVVALKKKGARRESLISFLISTPETGVDSIAISYALLGPVMAVVRPLTAIVTSIVAGAALMVSSDDREVELDDAEMERLLKESQEDDHDHAHGHGDAHGAPDAGDACCDHDAPPLTPPAARGRFGAFFASLKGDPSTRLGRIVGFAAKDLLDDITFWLLLGVLIAGLLTTVLPANFLGEYLGSGLFSMLVAAGLGLPLYMCASASTPMAAAFVAKGLNPGAALVFLLTGPATNAATITIISRFFGSRFVKIYVLSILVVGLLAGAALNRLLAFTGWTVTPVVEPVSVGTAWGLAKIIGTTVLALLMLRSLARTGLGEGLSDLARNLEWISGGRVALTRDGMRGLGTRMTGLPEVLGRWGRRAGAVALVLWAVSGVFAVQPGQVAYVKRFGEVLGEARGPGLHLAWPAPIDRVDRFALGEVRKVDVGFRGDIRALFAQSEADSQGNFWQSCYTSQDNRPEESSMLTGDENLIEAKSAVHYRIADPYRYHYEFGDAPSLVRALAEEAMRRAIGIRGIDTILTGGRESVAEDARALLQSKLEEYGAGVEVVFFDLVDLHPPAQAIDSFRDVASAKEDKQARIEKAESYKNATIPKARGEAVKLLKAAEDDRAESVLRATGDGAAFTAQVIEYEKAPDLTRTRMLIETMEKVLPYVEKYITTEDGRGVEFWMDGAARPPAR
ncbi:MAG: SO_0444 family Cu/Zn efflux transporter [Myxococcales bacterium]|nr:SO_0444 family Cu/Zn efflux transporter [Myxococcales bacterium]